MGIPHGEALASVRRQTSPMSNAEGHWMSFTEFREVELARRTPNAGDITTGRLFLSHCWRQTSQQKRKRRMVAELSLPVSEGGPGLAYWSDWLDLQSNGPVEWQKVIQEGIEESSKMVCFVDAPYLASFNCLKEVAYAMECGKPVVIIVLDMEAWNTLSTPGGAQKMWDTTTWGTPLSNHIGADFPTFEYSKDGASQSGGPFSLEVLVRLFARLSSINFCPCRDLDEANLGLNGILSNMVDYVSKELGYMKEHANLKSLSAAWITRGRPSSLLLHRNEALKWQQWTCFAEQAQIKPAPTPEQKEFVSKSAKRARRVAQTAVVVASVLLALILGGVVLSSVMWVRAEEAEHDAEVNGQSAAMWTILGKISEPSGSVYEIRALLEILRLCSLSASAPHRFAGIQTDASRVFYKIMSHRCINTGEVEGLTKAWSLAWSPGSSHLAVGSELEGNHVVVQPVDGSLPSRRWLLGPGSTVHSLSWSAAGTLAAGDLTGDVFLWDVSRNSSRRLPGRSGAWLEEGLFPVAPVAWLDNGTLLSSGGADGSLRLWDAGLPEPAFQELPPAEGSGQPHRISVSPDGKVVAVSGNYQTTFRSLGDEEGGEEEDLAPLLTIPAQGFVPSDVSFSEDGATLYLASNFDLMVYSFRPPSSQEGDVTASCELSCHAFDVVEADWADKLWYAEALYQDALSDFHRQQLHSLGWNASSWAECGRCRKNRWGDDVARCVRELYKQWAACPISQLALWSQLSPEERLAATNLGYTAASWDATSPVSCCSYSSSSSVEERSLLISGILLPGQEPSANVLGSKDTDMGAHAGLQVEPFAALQPLAGIPKVLTRVAASADGRHLAAGTEAGALVWDLTGGQGSTPILLPGTFLNDVLWSPDSRYLATATATGSAAIWDFQLDGPHAPRALPPHTADLSSVAFDPLHDWRVVAGSTDGFLVAHNLADGSQQKVALPRPDLFVNSVSFSPGSSTLVVGGSIPPDGDTGELYICDTKSWSCSAPAFVGPEELMSVNEAVWSMDGSLLCVATGGFRPPQEVTVWDMTSMNPNPAGRFSLDGLPLCSALSHDSRLVAAGLFVTGTNLQNFHVWDLASGGREVKLSFEGEADTVQPFGFRPTRAQWSPVAAPDGGYRLAVGADSGVLYLSEGRFAPNGSPLRMKSLHHHRDSIFAVAWSPDGQTLASASADGLLLLWDVTSEASMAQPQKIDVAGPGEAVLSLAWTPDGRSVAASGRGGFLKIIPYTPIDEMAGVLEGLLLPFTRTSFNEGDAVELNIAPGIFPALRQ